MKTLLIKAGKAFSTLKREGPIKGGKRVASAFFSMFGKVGSGDILFVTGGVGDSARYRALNQAEELKLRGFRCSVSVQDNPLLPGYADKFKIFIFHRVLYTPAVKKLIGRIKAQEKEVLFETDDLVYDPAYLKNMDYFKRINKFEKMLYENGVGGEILKDDYVKTCVTTTSFLAEKLKEHGKKVFISRNKLSLKDLETVEEIERNKPPKKEREIAVGYLSGTISHNKDFATVNDALREILRKYPHVRLVLAGPLDIDSLFDAYKSQIIILPFVSREKYFRNIAGLDINLAPLEIGNPYCEAKSELKFFEAGILGVPTVAAATQTFCEAIEDGVDGFIASHTEEWKDKLERLINNKDLRKKIGEKARKKTFRDYTNKNSHNEEYYAYLKSKLN